MASSVWWLHCGLVEPPSCTILARSSGELAAAPTSALAASPRTFMLRRRLLSLNHMNEPLRASDFSSTVASPLSTFTELKAVRSLLWIELQLRECYGGFDLLSRDRKTHHTSNEVTTPSYYSSAHWRSTSISFKNFSFAFIAWLTGTRGLAFSLSWFLTCFPHWAWSFDLKWEICDSSLYLNTWRPL